MIRGVRARRRSRSSLFTSHTWTRARADGRENSARNPTRVGSSQRTSPNHIARASTRDISLCADLNRAAEGARGNRICGGAGARRIARRADSLEMCAESNVRWCGLEEPRSAGRQRGPLIARASCCALSRSRAGFARRRGRARDSRTSAACTHMIRHASRARGRRTALSPGTSCARYGAGSARAGVRRSCPGTRVLRARARTRGRGGLRAG